MKFLITTLTLLLSTLSFNGRAQDAEKIQKLTAESMINHSDATRMEIAWMIPDEFWEYVINSSPELAGTDIADEFYGVLADYTIIAIVVGSQSYGRLSFVSEDALRNTTRLNGQDGNVYEPLKTSEQSIELQSILDIFKPIFSQMLGQVGENFHFFTFQKENSDGKLIFDPISDKDVTLDAGGAKFTWELPMSSLIPQKRCPKDGELMNGTWNYCPIHGKELEVVED